MTNNLSSTLAITVACVLLHDCFAQVPRRRVVAVPLQPTAFEIQPLKTFSAFQSQHPLSAPQAKREVLATPRVQSQGIRTFPSPQPRKLSPLPVKEPAGFSIPAIATKKPSAALAPSAIGILVPFPLMTSTTQPPPVATPLPLPPHNPSITTLLSPKPVEPASKTYTLTSNSIKSAAFAIPFSTEATAMKEGAKATLPDKTLTSHKKRKVGKHPRYRFKSKRRSKATKKKVTALGAYSPKPTGNPKAVSTTYISPTVLVAPVPITYSPNSVKGAAGLPPGGFIVIMRTNGALEPILRVPLRQ